MLLKAIVAHMDTYEDAGLSWRVCGINLRYAIERELYFKFISKLEYFYTLYYSGKKDSHENRFVSDILALLLGQEIRVLSAYPPLKQEPIEDLLGSFSKDKELVLFNIVSPKFLNYVRELVTSLGCKAHLLCNNRVVGLEELVQATNIPYSLVDLEYGDARIGGHFSKTMSARCLTSLVENVVNIRPAAIVNLEGCHVEDQLLCEIGNALGIDTVCIQYGYPHFYPLTVRNMSYKKFLVWGEYFGRGLEKYNSASIFYPVGHHKLPEPIESDLSAKVDAIGFLLQGVKYYITQNHFDKFIEFMLGIAKQFPDVKCYVREHPSSPISEDLRRQIVEAGIEFRNSSDCEIGDFLKACKLLVSISASSLVEAIGMGLIPIYVNLPGIKAFDRLLENNSSVFSAKSTGEASSIITKLISDEDYYRLVSQKSGISRVFMFKDVGAAALNNILGELVA